MGQIEMNGMTFSGCGWEVEQFTTGWFTNGDDTWTQIYQIIDSTADIRPLSRSLIPSNCGSGCWKDYLFLWCCFMGITSNESFVHLSSTGIHPSILSIPQSGSGFPLPWKWVMQKWPRSRGSLSLKLWQLLTIHRSECEWALQESGKERWAERTGERKLWQRRV